MKAITLKKPVLMGLFLALAVIFFIAGKGLAEDTEIYKAYAKNNAMITIDVSGSMAWPVYEHTVDYKAFFEWAVAQGLATDDHDLDDGPGAGVTMADLEAKGFQKNKIYLVAAYMGYAEVLGEDGTTTYPLFGDPIYEGSTKRQKWVSGGIIDTGWEITDWDTMTNNIETVTDATDGKQYVVYPTSFDHDRATKELTDLRWDYDVSYVTSNIAGERFKNNRDIVLTDFQKDPRTGILKDYGFQGYLKSAGLYYAGLFEKDSGGNFYQLTDDPDEALSSGFYDEEYVYAFVTGNFLYFIKLIEDLQGAGSCDTEAWKDICYKEGGEEEWISQTIDIYSHDTVYDCDQDVTGSCAAGTYDYPNPDLGNFNRGEPIDPPGDVIAIKVKFEYIDTDYCDSTGRNNDYVEFLDRSGDSLLCIKGQQIHPGTSGSGAAVSYDGGRHWTSKTPLDADGYTEEISADYIQVRWHNGSRQDCDGYDRGFHITGYKYRYEDPTAGGETFTCCNGSDGVGQKVRSRLEIAQEAMTVVVEETEDKISWGLVRWSGTGISLKANIPSSAQAIKTVLYTLNAGGGTPMGKGMQYSFDWIYTIAAAQIHQEECIDNFMVLMTDGYPSGDDTWDAIDKNSNPDPIFTLADYHDSDFWGGDPNQGEEDESNYSDDVARWMARGKCDASQDTTGNGPDHNVVTHTIGFGLDSPLLADVAEEGCGINITAYNRAELINAFYSLGLAMSSSVAFTAPVVSVDEASRTQSGDKLYVAFFKSKGGEYWQGNLKKYGLALKTRWDDCGRSVPEWTIVGQDSTTIAVDCEGKFKVSSTSFWSTEPDGDELDKGGAGGVLMAKLNAITIGSPPADGYYGFRKIYTHIDGIGLVRITPDNGNITPDLFGLDPADELTKYKIINFLYGYTYGAVSEADSTPVGKRSWILGDIIHSQPVVIDYLSNQGVLKYRFIVVGANDGMLHVFLDTVKDDLAPFTWGGKTYSEGEEIFAFVPPDLLDTLIGFADPEQHFYTVDGSANLFRDHTVLEGGYHYKTLVFGERRGGNNYWALNVSQPDPSLWSVRWNIQGGQGDFAQLGQSWNKPFFGRIQTAAATYNNVMIFTGGYDAIEDGFPEPFEDDDHDGARDTNEAYTNSSGGTSNQYDKYNPSMDSQGKGIFVADLATGSHIFSATYGDDDEDDDENDDMKTGTTQTFCRMKYCFPADPSVVSFNTKKLLIYAADIYGQIWKVYYAYDTVGGQGAWTVNRIFAANGKDMPLGADGTNRGGADTDTGSVTDFMDGVTLDSDDIGRKTFYSPDLSYGGNDWTGRNVLYFGTGDRAHPSYTMISDRFYTVADYSDSSDVTDERHLLNLTCDELDDHADSDGDGTLELGGEDTTRKNYLKDILKNQYTGQLPDHQCRGWYRVLDQQGACSQYFLGEPDDAHVGEKVLSQPTLFFKNVYFTTYQPVFDDPCYALGKGRVYALDFSWGKAAMNYYLENDTDEEERRDIRDTFMTLTTGSIPSDVRVIIRGGKAAGILSCGGSVPGAGVGFGTTIPGSAIGAFPLLWKSE